MTQEYTPTTDDAIDLIVAGMGVVTQLGIAPVGYPRTETDAVEAAKRWIATHDAQIRADERVKALKLTDEETSKADEAYWKYTGLGMTKKSMIQNAFKAVAEHREQNNEVQQ